MRSRPLSLLFIGVLLLSGVISPASAVAPAAAAGSAAAAAPASLDPVYCYNWDFFNNTGSPANDLHITLMGPTALLETFSEPPGQVSVQPVPGGVSVTFIYAPPINPGGVAHIGFCANAAIFDSAGGGGLPPFYWTLNGQPLTGMGIPVLPMPGWTWLWQGDQRGHFQIGLANDNGTPISIRSVRVFQPAALLPLSGLNTAAVQGLTPIWQSSGPPVGVNPGLQSFFDIFPEIGESVPPPTENTPLIAVAVIDNPLAPPPLNTITLLAQTTFVMPPPPDYCYNWDFVNDTGMAVNDLHIVMRGPRVLSDVYMGPLNPFGGPGPGSGFDAMTGLYTLAYNGVTIPPGGTVHTGFCSDNPIVSMTVTWTLNGAPVGQPVPVPGWQWNAQPGGGTQIGLTNPTASPMAIVAVRWAVTPQPIDLQNLNWTDPLVQALPFATLPGAVLPPGGSQLVPIPAPLPPGTIVVGNVQVAGANGQVVQFMAQGPVATLPQPDYCYNWDFTNWTGQPANDLHLTLHGPTELSDVYTGPLNPFGLPDPSSGYDPVEDVYHLNWSGATVAPGGVVHVGFCTDLPLVSFPGVGGLPPHYWTFNGAPINPATPIPVPGYDWQWMNDGSLEFGLSLAPGQPAVAIDAMEIAPVASLFDLDALTYANLGAQVPAGAWSAMSPLGGTTLNPGQQIFFAPPPGLFIQPRQPLVVRFRAIDTLNPTRIIWVAAQARARPRPRWWENYDIHVPPEAGPINDLHMEFRGVGPQGFFGFFPSPFFGPSAQQSYDPATGLTTLDFLPVRPGVTAPVSTTLHMGMHAASDRVRLVRGWWTRDGLPVGPPIGMGSIIYRGLPLPLEGAAATTTQELRLANDMVGSPLQVQMLQWTILPTAMPLEDMMWDPVAGMGLSWTSAIGAPTVLQPGASLQFLVNGAAGQYVLVRSITGAPGGPQVRNLAQHGLTLLGDLDNSCDVDVADVTGVASHWNTALGSAAFDPLYDVDLNDAVDIRDVQLVASQFGAACAP